MLQSLFYGRLQPLCRFSVWDLRAHREIQAEECLNIPRVLPFKFCSWIRSKSGLHQRNWASFDNFIHGVLPRNLNPNRRLLLPAFYQSHRWYLIRLPRPILNLRRSCWSVPVHFQVCHILWVAGRRSFWGFWEGTCKWREICPIKSEVVRGW